MRIYNKEYVEEKDLRAMIAQIVEREGSQWKAAIALGVNPNHLNGALKGRRGIGNQIPNALGYVPVLFYVKKEEM